MKKVKTIILAIGLACMAGCGDDDSKSNDGEMVSCKWGVNPFKNLCSEVAVSDLEKNGASVNDAKLECEGRSKPGQFANESCPNGYVLKCECDNENMVHKYDICAVYLYDDEYKDLTCSEFWDIRNGR